MDNTANWTLNHGASVQGFIFPILKPSEIVEIMSELGSAISKEELQDPAHHKERLRKTYAFLLEICTGQTEDDWLMTPEMQEAAMKTGNPELHTETTELQFFIGLRDLLHTAGYADFSFRDLHHPTSKRLRTQMSALLNFAKFREEQIKVYAELTEPRSHVLVKLEEVQEENVQLNAYLEEVQAQARQQLQELEEIMAECENLEVEIAESNKLQAAARQENVALNKQAKELKDQVDAAVWALQEAEAEEEGLRVKLVNSPDRYKQELFYKTEQLAKVKQECAELDRQIEQLKTKMARALQSLNELEQINRDLDEVLKLEKSYRAKLAQIEETKHRGEALQKRHNELRQSVDQVERQIARHEEKITAQRKQHELEMHGLSEALDLAKSRLLRVEKERRDAMSRIEAGEAEVRQIESLIAMEKQKTESEIHQWIAEYEVVEEAFLQKNEKRMAVLREQMNQGFPELETPAVQ